MCKRMKLDLYFTSDTKMNYKWIIDLDVRAKTITVLGVKIRKNLCDLRLGKRFLT